MTLVEYVGSSIKLILYRLRNLKNFLWIDFPTCSVHKPNKHFSNLCMDKLVNCCISMREVGPYLEKPVEELHKAFRGTEFSETPKIRIVLKHRNHCLHFLGRHGLGL